MYQNEIKQMHLFLKNHEYNVSFQTLESPDRIYLSKH